MHSDDWTAVLKHNGQMTKLHLSTVYALDNMRPSRYKNCWLISFSCRMQVIVLKGSGLTTLARTFVCRLENRAVDTKGKCLPLSAPFGSESIVLT